MKIFKCLLLTLCTVTAVLSADSVDIQDPSFLDAFNDQQKVAINNFLREELKLPPSTGLINNSDLKAIYEDLIERLSTRFGTTLTTERKAPRTCCSERTPDLNLMRKTLISTSKECESKSKSHCSNPIHITSHDTCILTT